jgi:hypothetical protein
MAKHKKTGGRKPGVPNKATRELKELAQPYAPEAINTLREIMAHGKTEAARVAAARELLDRGYGRPVGSGTQVNATSTNNTQVNVVCDEATRKALIAARERFLTEKPTSSPLPVHTKLQPGAIGATNVPEDPKIALMKSLECGITYEQAVCGADRLGRFGNTD